MWLTCHKAQLLEILLFSLPLHQPQKEKPSNTPFLLPTPGGRGVPCPKWWANLQNTPGAGSCHTKNAAGRSRIFMYFWGKFLIAGGQPGGIKVRHRVLEGQNRRISAWVSTPENGGDPHMEGWRMTSSSNIWTLTLKIKNSHVRDCAPEHEGSSV